MNLLLKKENQKITNNNKKYLPSGNKNDHNINLLNRTNNNDISEVNIIHLALKNLQIMGNAQKELITKFINYLSKFFFLFYR